jgi:hypothetical protein
MGVRLRQQAILAHGCNRNAERARSLLVGDSLAQPVDSLSEVHVCSTLDRVYAVGYNIGSGAAQYQDGWAGVPWQRMADPPASTERPEGRPLTKAALLDGLGQEDGVYDAEEAEGARAHSRREAGLHHRQADEEPLVGGARPERRAGVPHRVPEGRARGGAAARRLRRIRMNHTAAAGAIPCGCRDACPAA